MKEHTIVPAQNQTSATQWPKTLAEPKTYNLKFTTKSTTTMATAAAAAAAAAAAELNYSTYLPEVFHAIDVVIQQVRPRDADFLHLGKVGHARPLIVGHPPSFVRKVEAVRVLALDQREPLLAIENGTARTHKLIACRRARFVQEHVHMICSYISYSYPLEEQMSRAQLCREVPLWMAGRRTNTQPRMRHASRLQVTTQRPCTVLI